MPFKLFIALVLAFSLTHANEEETYVFEAKGEFAKELKSLVEKYSQEGKIEAKVYEGNYEPQSESKTMTQSILSALSPSEAEDLQYADIMQGERIYQQQCAKCHGANADDNSYTVRHKLIDLEPMKIVELLEGYKGNYDGQFGGNMRFLMQPQAEHLVGSEMQSVAVYIHSLKSGVDIYQKPSADNPSGAPAPKATTSQGTYLK